MNTAPPREGPSPGSPEDVPLLRARLRREGIAFDASPSDPQELFHVWQQQWCSIVPTEPYAAILATASAQATPSLRTITLQPGTWPLRFFTSSTSQKSSDLSANPVASVCFPWLDLGRQVRICGTTTRISNQYLDTAFTQLAPIAQALAVVSDQRSQVASRQHIVAACQRVHGRSQRQTLVRPAQWIGWELSATQCEFWQARADGIHDRLQYRRLPDDTRWDRSRLMP